MRENLRRGFERHVTSILGRSIIAGLLVLGFVGMAAGSAAGTSWKPWGPPTRFARDPEHHLHLEPARLGARREHLHGDGDGREKWQPGHLLHRLFGERQLQHLGRRRHVGRRRDLRHRRQPGAATPATSPPAQVQQIVGVASSTQSITFTSSRPPAARRRHLRRDRDGRGVGQPGHLHHRSVLDVRVQPAASRATSSRSPGQPGPASSTPTRPGNASYDAAPQVQQTVTVPEPAQSDHLHLDAARRCDGGRHLHRRRRRAGRRATR